MDSQKALMYILAFILACISIVFLGSGILAAGDTPLPIRATEVVVGIFSGVMAVFTGYRAFKK